MTDKELKKVVKEAKTYINTGEIPRKGGFFSSKKYIILIFFVFLLFAGFMYYLYDPETVTNTLEPAIQSAKDALGSVGINL